MKSGFVQTLVGEFFENLAQSTFGGELTRDSRGDLYFETEGSATEVKSSSHRSQYGFRLDTEQITKYESGVGVNFERVWYIFFAYENDRTKDSRGRRTYQLTLEETEVDKRRFLARKTKWCTVIDLSIVQGWLKYLPVSQKSVPGHLGTKTIDVRSRSVEKLIYNHKVELGKIGVPHQEFRFLRGTVATSVKVDEGRRRRVSFPVFCLIRKNDRVPASLRRVLDQHKSAPA